MILPPTTSLMPNAGIVIVEDYPVVRDGLVQLISGSPDLRVLAAVGDENSALSSIRQHRPDLVLLDLMLGGRDGLALIEQITRELPTMKILVLSMMNEAVYAERALRAGALGYIMKSAETIEVLQAIRSVLEGRVYLSPRIFVKLFRGILLRSTSSREAGAEGLSDRELHVFQLIGSGVPNRDIAVQLGISVKTVEAHRENIKNKLGLQDSSELSNSAQMFVNSLTP